MGGVAHQISGTFIAFKVLRQSTLVHLGLNRSASRRLKILEISFKNSSRSILRS